MIYVISKQKWQGEGRTFSSEGNPLKYLYVLLSDDGTLPNASEYVNYAPGTLCLDTANNKTYIFDNSTFKTFG